MAEAAEQRPDDEFSRAPEIPEGISEDARESWPSRELIDSFLGDEPHFVEFRAGEGVEVETPEAEEWAQAFRDVLGRYCSGVTVVTTVSRGEPLGMTCQSFTSVSLDPPLVAFLPQRSSRAFAAIQRSGRFCVNFLAADQTELSNRFASRAENKFAGVSWETSANGSPLLPGTVGYVDCTVHTVHEAGDHYLVLGRVRDLASSGAGRPDQPLLYYQGRYVTSTAGPA